MKSFYHNGKEISFHSSTGTVTGAHKRSETHVHGGGGGGTNQVVRVSSTVTVKQEFFLNRAEGDQLPVQLANEDIPVTDGQQVTVVYANAGDRGRWACLVNHSSRFWYRLGDGSDIIKFKLVRGPFATLGIGLLIFAFGGNLNGWLAFLGAVGFVGFEMAKAYKVSKALEAHIKEGAQNILNNPPPRLEQSPASA